MISLLAASALLLGGVANAQWYQEHNLTPDGYWHNRYHMLLSMAAYGDYNTLCPNQTFTEENKLRNFPESTRAPWTVINTFGPTPSGCEGYTAIVPEMNKALIIFKGNLDIEKNIDQRVASWDVLTPQLAAACHNCTVNAFAAQAYMECRNETNNWKAIRDAYAGQQLVFSIAGHGFGGMMSQLASVDLNVQNVAYYSHAYGNPRLFNQKGADFYNTRFNGEAGERGIAGNDLITEIIPESENYTHAGTAFYYYGFNSSSTGMNWDICWTEDGLGWDACMPREQGDGATPDASHYFYFSNVGQCGGNNRQNLTAINAWLADKANTTPDFSVTAATNLVTSTSSSSSSIALPTANVTSSAPTNLPTNGAASTPPPGNSGAADLKASFFGIVLAASAVLFL